MIEDCPSVQKNTDKHKSKTKKDHKRARPSIRSDDYLTIDKCNEDQRASVCLMGNGDSLASMKA